MSIFWDELDKDQQQTLNQRVASAFLAAPRNITETPEEYAQNPDHQQTLVVDRKKGTYQTRCSCGQFTGTAFDKDSVPIHEDFLDPENAFTPDEVEKARHDAAERAARSEFGTHASQFQREDDLEDLSSQLDTKHTQDVADLFGQRDLEQLLAETGGSPRTPTETPSKQCTCDNNPITCNIHGVNAEPSLPKSRLEPSPTERRLETEDNGGGQARPSGQTPIIDRGRQEPLDDSTYKDRGGVSRDIRVDNIINSLQKSKPKVEEYVQRTGIDPERASRPGVENLIRDLQTGETPPENPPPDVRMPADLDETISPPRKRPQTLPPPDTFDFKEYMRSRRPKDINDVEDPEAP